LQDGKIIAGLYMDLYSRPNKTLGGYSGKLQWKTENTIPIGLIVLNFHEDDNTFFWPNAPWQV
jgi:Zn-dependent oligopeptidase